MHPKYPYTTPVALATVTQTWGSAPRGVGAKMLVHPSGQHEGSVSGGCVEGAIIEIGARVLQTGAPALVNFGVTDEQAWGVGLACGGEIEILVERLSPQEQHARDGGALPEDGLMVAAVLPGQAHFSGERLIYRSGAPPPRGTLANLIAPHAQQARLSRQSQKISIPYENGDLQVFIDIILPPDQLLIIGGAHIAIPLTQFAGALGYRVTIIDPRRAFANPQRFPEADEILAVWPSEAFAQLAITASTAMVMLSHDPKIDDPALQAALNSPAFYIGALGSRTTQAQRRARLGAAGFALTQLDRIHGPVGLNLGGRQPAEIALAIMAEITQIRNRKDESAQTN